MFKFLQAFVTRFFKISDSSYPQCCCLPYITLHMASRNRFRISDPRVLWFLIMVLLADCSMSHILAKINLVEISFGSAGSSVLVKEIIIDMHCDSLRLRFSEPDYPLFSWNPITASGCSTPIDLCKLDFCHEFVCNWDTLTQSKYGTEETSQLCELRKDINAGRRDGS